MSISAPRSGALPAARGFVPALEAMRAVAALAVLITHVAFQIGENTGSPVNRIMGRLDLAVALFFALSGFLLWRRSARRARSADPETPSVRTYLERRLVRILPAYLTVTLVALALLPPNSEVGPVTWFANLTLTQIYIPETLTAGLTHAWSLAVEMAFYLVLPLLWIALSRLRGDAARWRVPVIAGAGLLSLGWALVPWHALGLPEGVNDQILPPAFASWFAGGMVLAELVAAPRGRMTTLAAHPASKWGWWAAAAACFLATTNPAWFTEGFVHPSGPEFAVRTGLGALTAFLLLGPIILSPDHLGRFPILNSPPMTALGRWSYGVFLWHVVVLYYAFEIVDVPMFSGYFWPVFLVTVVLSVAAGAVSFALVEEPARTAYDRRFRPGRAASRAAEEARAAARAAE